MKNATSVLGNLWPVIAAILVASAAVGATGAKLYHTEADVCDLQAKDEEQEKRLARLEEAITELPEIRNDIKELLRRVR